MERARGTFISYSHDSEAHIRWVLNLATYLQKNGIEVILDQWELGFGDDVASFMEKSIKDTDSVLCICTDAYIKKANAGTGGVGYEKKIVTSEILSNPSKRSKFIPVVRDVTGPNKLPTFAGGSLYVDMSGQDTNQGNRTKLLKRLHGVASTKPPLGESPFPAGKVAQNEMSTEDVEPVRPSWSAPDGSVAFSKRFAQAFPGVRGTQWFDDPETVAARLGILLAQPLLFKEGYLTGS